ncbi:hypothetical protein [Avibacterium paragallinarum]|uniref:hypothetical protein n=1 Tax=Avibacterium paragallinarum TaxID=728 RepID=UPI003979D963
MTIQHQHIIELSNRYQIVFSDNGFILYQLDLTDEGVWKRSKGQLCRNFEAVVETLEHCELNNEDVNSLRDCASTLQAILGEVKEIKALSVSQ